MDNYDLVVLKTLAICEYGVSGGARRIVGYFFFLARFYMVFVHVFSSQDAIIFVLLYYLLNCIYHPFLCLIGSHGSG